MPSYFYFKALNMNIVCPERFKRRIWQYLKWFSRQEVLNLVFNAWSIFVERTKRTTRNFELIIGGIYNIYNVEFSRKIKKLLKIDKNFFDTLNLTYIIPIIPNRHASGVQEV